jgi:hypothetical protein
MEPTTLYYFFTANLQVLAAILALLAVFTHLTINEIKDLLIEDGRAILKRWEERETGYPPNVMNGINYFKRLEDDIGRGSFSGISDIIKKLAEFERLNGRSLDIAPRGFQYLEDSYMKKISKISKIKSLIKYAIKFAFISIGISLISIIFVEKLIKYCSINWFIISLIILVTFLSMLFTIRAIFRGL